MVTYCLGPGPGKLGKKYCVKLQELGSGLSIIPLQQLSLFLDFKKWYSTFPLRGAHIRGVLGGGLGGGFNLNSISNLPTSYQNSMSNFLPSSPIHLCFLVMLIRYMYKDYTFTKLPSLFERMFSMELLHIYLLSFLVCQALC